MNWNNIFPADFFISALAFIAIFLVMPVVIYFLIISAIANRVNPRPNPKQPHGFPIKPNRP